jgi:hypothetical protein
MRNVMILCILLALSMPVAAESIVDCVLTSPHDSTVLAWQSVAIDGNLPQYDLAPLAVDYPALPDHAVITTQGTRVGRYFYWTDTARREAWEYALDGHRYLFVFGDPRLPGVRVVDPAAPFYVPVDHHGGCTLQFS